MTNRILLSLPYAYAYRTRYQRWFYFACVEHVPAVLICLLYGKETTAENILICLLSYFSFISLYEIGYIANDYLSTKREASPSLRGPDVEAYQILLWVFTRLFTFWGATTILERHWNLSIPGFWSFLCIVFALHNTLRPSLKVCTFGWLACARFIAPNILVLSSTDLWAVLTAGLILHIPMRMLSYLEGKKFLTLPDRKNTGFRLIFYAHALIGLVVIDPQLQWQSPATVLGLYYLCLAVGEWMMSLVKHSE